MGNSNYRKGTKREYKIIFDAVFKTTKRRYTSLREINKKEKDLVCIRSAGSHSDVDCVIIDKINKKIRLIQAKPDSMNEHQRQKLRDENKDLNGNFKVSFSVV